MLRQMPTRPRWKQAVTDATAARDAVLAEATLGGQTLAAQGIVGNELTTVNNDIMVLANPEIARLPGWVIALVAAGGLAAALSTAAGLLLAISSAISHDLIKGALNPKISEKGELLAARISMAFAIVLATWLGLDPPGFAAQVVALAFGLAAATIFPVLMMGIFSTTRHQGRRDRGDAGRSDFDGCLHLHLPGLVLRAGHQLVAEHAGRALDGHLARGLWSDRCDPELCVGLHRVGDDQGTAAGRAGPDPVDPRAERCRCGAGPLSTIESPGAGRRGFPPFDIQGWAGDARWMRG